MTAGPLPEIQDVDELDERRRLEEEGHAAEAADEQQDGAGDVEADEPPLDPLRVAVRLLDEALADVQEPGVSRAQRIAHKIAIAHGFATVSVAMASRSQYNLEAQLTAIQMQDRQAMIAAQGEQAGAEKSGLVVARLNPAGR